VQLNLSPELLKLIGETVVSVEISLKEKLLRKTVRGIPVNVAGVNVPGHAPIEVISVRPDQVSLRLVRQKK
jgi:hypothetical protein